MKSSIAVFFAASLVAALSTAPSIAATSLTTTPSAVTTPAAPTFDTELASVKGACLGATATKDACDAAVAAYVAAVKAANLAPGASDDALATLVVALAENASKLTPEVRTIVVAAIQSVAPEFQDKARGDQVVKIADTVASGQDVQTAAIQVPASPTR